MTQRWWAGMLVGGHLLGGCAASHPTTSEADFEDLRAAMTASRTARDTVAVQCRGEIAARPEDERALIGAMLDVDTTDVPAEFCARLVAAIARGDLDYADYVAISEGGTDPALIRRFLRAIRLDPSAVAS